MPSAMLFFCGFCVLMLRILAAEACSANQQSAVTLTETSGTILNIWEWLTVKAKCQWTLTAPVGQVFRIDLRAYIRSKTCSGDEYVRLYDGSSTASNLMAETKCGDRTIASYFYSSGRNLLLELKTGPVVNTTRMDAKYQAHVKQECSTNSTLVAPKAPTEHNFSSPYYPYGNRRNTTCGWFITAPENHVVMLQLALQLSERYETDNDNVEVFDVDGSELTPIAIPESNGEKIYSKFRFVYVVFKSDDVAELNNRNGISVKYSAIKTVRSCSSSNSNEENNNILLKDPSGTIKTPGYPNGYPGNLITECHWKIIVPKGNVVRIEFSSFRLYERVRIYDYKDKDDSAVITDSINGLNPRSVEQSGREPSFYFFSTGNELSIKIKSKAGNTGPGFTANYASVPTALSGACDLEKNSRVHMAGEGRSFSSPGYPSYPGKGSCTWNITVSPGHLIKLTFWNIEQCSQNYVKVYDVTNSTRVLLGKFCSKYTKEVVYSQGNNVLVKFTVKRHISQTGGFFATYESIKAIPAEYSCTSGRITLTETSGEFASYGYPLPYSNDAKCRWHIEAPVGNVVQLKFHSFDLQPSQDCEADYVDIKYGSYSWPTVIGRFCGSSSPGLIQVNDSNVYVEFKTDSSGKYPGFHASYKILPDPTMGSCKNPGQDNLIPLTGASGTLFSPLYPRKFQESITCTWVITVPDGHFVRLRIKAFDFGLCEKSSLKIRDGQSSSSTLLKSFCLYTFEKSLFSSSRHLWVQYNAQDPIGGDMFYAVFEAVKQLPAPFACTDQTKYRKLESETGTLASYNYPLSYDDSLECVWFIYTDTDQKIELSFDFFNLSDSTDCSEDYVEVRNGQWDTSDLAGKFCGSEKPSSITSDDWEMRVAFKSSGKNKYPGFKATYKTKNTVGAILKIVGIVVGALSAVCAMIGACCKYGSCCKDDEPQIVQGSFRDEAESVPLQEEATTKV